MRPWNSDLVIGIAGITCVLSFVGYYTGLGNALTLIFVWVLCVVIPWLWNSNLRIVAIILLPAVLLQYLLPKAIRAAVNALPSETLVVGPNE